MYSTILNSYLEMPSLLVFVVLMMARNGSHQSVVVKQSEIILIRPNHEFSLLVPTTRRQGLLIMLPISLLFFP
jgi:hypothetical protein